MVDTIDILLKRQFDDVQRQDAQVEIDPAATDTIAAISNLDGVARIEPVAAAGVVVSAGDRRYATELMAFDSGTTMHDFGTGLPDAGLVAGRSLGALLDIDLGDTVTIARPDRLASLELPVGLRPHRPLHHPRSGHRLLGVAPSQRDERIGTFSSTKGAGPDPSWKLRPTRPTRRAEEAMRETSTTERPIHQSGDRQPIRHIAVCIDRSPIGDRAMPHAVAVARAFDARLTLLHVLEPSHDGLRAALTGPLDWEVQRTEAQRHLEGLRSGYVGVEPAGGAALTDVEAEVLEGRPAESIRHWVQSHDVDLTVLSSHGERGRTDWALASTARKLVEGVRGSVLLVPAHPFGKPSTEAAIYRRVLVPLDGSARAECALAVADRIARSEGPELLLLHVVSAPPHPCPGPLDDQERDLDRLLVDRNVRAATTYLKGVARRLEGGGVRVQTQVVVDRDVRDEIQDRIDFDDVDLVVLSGHGHGGRAQQPVGSVARLLIEHLTAPLLIVRDSSLPDPPTGPDARSQAGVRLPHATEG